MMFLWRVTARTSSHFVYCGEDSVSMSAGRVAVLSNHASLLPPLTTCLPAKALPSLLTTWIKAEPKHALGSYAALGEKKCDSENLNLQILHAFAQCFQPSSGPGGPQGSSRNPQPLLLHLALTSLATRRECLHA